LVQRFVALRINWVTSCGVDDEGDSNLYRYVNNAPTDATDPSGKIVVTTLEEKHQGAGGYGNPGHSQYFQLELRQLV
jgi:hypothetical protein